VADAGRQDVQAAGFLSLNELILQPALVGGIAQDEAEPFACAAATFEREPLVVVQVWTDTQFSPE
jgi:hypothetical protein